MSQQPTPHPVLDLPMTDGRTIRRWFVDVMIALIVDPEGFSGKRPLGDSSWWSELLAALEDGDIVGDDAEVSTVNAVLMGAVSEGFGLVPNGALRSNPRTNTTDRTRLTVATNEANRASRRRLT